jgi:hypothetical protein
VSIIVEERLHLSEHASALQERGGQAIGFTESERQGRASGASLVEDGRVSYSLTGTSPQGEEDTLAVCRLLVGVLRAAGEDWADPTASDGVVDCLAPAKDNPRSVLKIQVVRAIPDPDLWSELSRVGRIDRAGVDRGQLVSQLRAAVQHKASDKKVPPSVRPDLVLALDANRLPGLTLDAVVEDYRTEHGAWTASHGFRAVWLVGPTARLTWRLDIVAS